MAASFPGVSPTDFLPVLADDYSTDRKSVRTSRALVGQFYPYPHPLIIRRGRPSHLIPFSPTMPRELTTRKRSVHGVMEIRLHSTSLLPMRATASRASEYAMIPAVAARQTGDGIPKRPNRRSERSRWILHISCQLTSVGHNEHDCIMMITRVRPSGWPPLGILPSAPPVVIQTPYCKSVRRFHGGRTVPLATRARLAVRTYDRALRCFQWVTQREVMYAGSGWVRVGSWSLAAMR
jgi:hypothetical protein